MSLFVKLGWIEEETQEGSNVPVADVAETEKIDANIDSKENIVATVYAQNNLEDVSNSIYAVGKLIGTLPKEMTTQKMQETIAGILVVTEKSVPALIQDAKKRIGVLNAACASVVAERTAEIECANADIEKLKQAIEVAQKVIKNAGDIREATKQQIAEEVEEIEKLIEFSEGMVCQQ